MKNIFGIDGLFRPYGAPTLSRLDTHGLRRGLHSFRRFAAGANGITVNERYLWD